MAACPAYWVVDPITPAITVWELEDGAYVERQTVTGADTLAVTWPYDLAAVPDELVL